MRKFIRLPCDGGRVAERSRMMRAQVEISSVPAYGLRLKTLITVGKKN